MLGSRLALTDRVSTGGSEPNAVAQHGNLVYVLNTAGSASVVGFRWDDGRLNRIADSLRFLSGNFVDSASLAFSGDGRFLVVTERTTNNIDVFRVLADGKLSAIKVNPSVGAGAFSVAFARNGAVLVSETGGGAGRRSRRTRSWPMARCCRSARACPRSARPTAGRGDAGRPVRLCVERRHLVDRGLRDRR